MKNYTLQGIILRAADSSYLPIKMFLIFIVFLQNYISTNLKELLFYELLLFNLENNLVCKP